MSFADYTQKAEDHQCMLVVVKQVGNQLKPKTFNRIFEHISRIQSVRIQSQQRTIWLRYKRNYPLENNEWGQFQVHRRVLGMLCIGRSSNETEIEDVYSKYDDFKQQYSSTLYDSRLVIFGMNKDGTPIAKRISRDNSTDSETGGEIADNKDLINSNQEDKQNSNITIPVKDTNENDSINRQRNSNLGNANKDHNKENLEGSGQRPGHGNSTGKDNSRTHVLFYPHTEDLLDLEMKLQDFAASLFWVLESKRLDRSRERMDKLPLLTAPFEKKDFVGIDTEGSILIRAVERELSLIRDAGILFLTGNRTYKKRCQGRLRKHLADLCLLAGLPAEALLHYQTSLDVLRSANDWLWVAAALEGLCSASVVIMFPQAQRPAFSRNLSFSVKRGSSAMQEARLRTGGFRGGIANGLDLADTRGRHLLLPDDVIDKYKEAIMHYSKFKSAGIVEMEASIKACRVLIMQRKNLEASEFLQNVVYINLPLSEEEKIQRYSTLSLLYGQIGFHRKAAFFKRVAAMQCVTPANPNPGWLQCYHLLLQALDGYRLSVDPKDMPMTYTSGWPTIQLRVLHELIYSARRMGNPAIAVRHLSFLLHTMFDHLTSEDRKELAGVLESYTAKSEGNPTPLPLDNGITLAPVSFTRFPVVRQFKLHNLALHLRPVNPEEEAMKDSQSSGLFIYSPLQLGVAKPRRSGPKLDFKWVEGDVCEVSLQLYNPMPFDLKVSNMGLLTEGVDFESYPVSLVLSAESGPHPIKIMGTPKESGLLTVIGYTSQVLGVRSHCKLAEVAGAKFDHYEVDVVPVLPQMSVSTSLPKAASFTSLTDSASIVTSATCSLFAGQSCECQVTLTNSGKEVISSLKLSLNSKIEQSFLHRVLVWDQEKVDRQLPLQPNSQISFTLHIHGASDFLPAQKDDTAMSRSSSGMTCRGAAQLPPDGTNCDSSNTRVVEALLKFQYSGPAGLVEGYWRQCAVAVTVEIQPSLVFTNWDVIPAESLHHCHLVLDIENVTTHETEVICSPDNTVIIEARQIRRVAVEMERQVLPTLSEVDLQSSWPYVDSAATWEPISQHIDQCVDVRWKMASVNMEGKLCLGKLQWKQRHLVMLGVSPVGWDVSINSKEYKRIEQCSFHVGEIVNVKVYLKNNADSKIEDVHLSMQCYQDNHGSWRDLALEDQMARLGCNRDIFQQIPVGHRCEHESSYVFFCPGIYKLDLKCSGKVKKEVGPDDSRQPITDKYIDTKEPISKEKQTNTLSIWTYSPPVVLNITEH